MQAARYPKGERAQRCWLRGARTVVPEGPERRRASHTGDQGERADACRDVWKSQHRQSLQNQACFEPRMPESGSGRRRLPCTGARVLQGSAVSIPLTNPRDGPSVAASLKDVHGSRAFKCHRRRLLAEEVPQALGR